MLVRKFAIAALIPIALMAPAACGGSSDSGGSTTSTATQTPDGSLGVSTAKIRACLKAAGISTKGLPGAGGGNMPSGQPPSSIPTGVPSQMPSGAAGGGGILNNVQARQALQACGISIPSTAPSAGQ